MHVAILRVAFLKTLGPRLWNYLNVLLVIVYLHYSQIQKPKAGLTQHIDPPCMAEMASVPAFLRRVTFVLDILTMLFLCNNSMDHISSINFHTGLQSYRRGFADPYWQGSFMNGVRVKNISLYGAYATQNRVLKDHSNCLTGMANTLASFSPEWKQMNARMDLSALWNFLLLWSLSGRDKHLLKYLYASKGYILSSVVSMHNSHWTQLQLEGHEWRGGNVRQLSTVPGEENVTDVKHFLSAISVSVSLHSWS